MKYITKTILLLSLISLFTDIASEMLYPVMPMYLKSIGFSVLLIGILEGIAEATAGFSKGYFGNLSDHLGKRRPFVQVGYALSAFSKPLMALWTHPLGIFLARTTDRLGKGVRTAARDTMLSSETSPEFKGRVFGFHRGFDTLGAAIGPILALAFLTTYPEAYRELFLLAFIPGLLAVVTTFVVKEKPRDLAVNSPRTSSPPGFFTFLTYWKKAPRDYRLLIVGLLAFALVNSSDVLLLLMMKHNGATDQQVILVYVFYNVVYALASFPMGILGDKIGLRWAFMFGLFLFAVVYGGIMFATSVPVFLVLFLLYGVYAASTEGISKAWISNIVPEGETATAIGLYTGLNSVSALLASSMAGWLWFSFGPTATFGLSAVGALLVMLFFAVVLRRGASR